MNSYHPKESQMLDISTQLNLTKSEWDIAFHTILRKPLSFFLQQKDKIFSNVNQKYGSILDNGNTYGSDDYQTIYNLNTSQSGRIHQKAFTAWFYIQCLRKLNYFSDEISNIISNEITEEEFYIAKLYFPSNSLFKHVILFLFRMMCELETNCVALERIFEYIDNRTKP